MRTVTGTVTIPRYEDDTQLDRFAADTLLMADFNFVGPSLGSTDCLFEIYIPSLKLTKAEAPVAGPGTISATYDFEALVPAARPYGFPTDRKGGELIINLQNNVATNVLYAT